MLVQVVPGDPPIKVDSVTEVSRRGAPHWSIKGAPAEWPSHAGRVRETVSYTVPKDWPHLRWIPTAGGGLKVTRAPATM